MRQLPSSFSSFLALRLDMPMERTSLASTRASIAAHVESYDGCSVGPGTPVAGQWICTQDEGI